MDLSAIQPARYDTLFREKTAAIAQCLSPWFEGQPEIFSSPAAGFRMRAEFRVWHDGDDLNYVMFERRDNRAPVIVDDFVIAADTIRDLMPVVRNHLRSNPVLRHRLFQVEFLTTLSGEALLSLVYHRRLDDEWRARASALREALAGVPGSLQLVGRSRGQKVVLGRDYVIERLNIDGKVYTYRQYDQAFTQPNARVNQQMIEWALARARELPREELLELYCGNGNFTLPLSRLFHTTIATEVAKQSVRAARENLEDNNIHNVHLVRMSAEEVSMAVAGVREFRRLSRLPRPLNEGQPDTLFVDPPRAGLDRATLALAERFSSVIYVSCNPLTLADNLQVLDATHSVTHLALFDQFPYTPHMECAVLLRHRSR